MSTYHFQQEHRTGKRGHRSQSSSMSALEFASIDLPSHFRENDIIASAATGPLNYSISSDSNDSHDLLVQALEKAHSFSESRPRNSSTARGEPSNQHRERWGSCPDREHQLQLRRHQAETSVQKLFDDRKDHIFEIFQDSWIISDALDDEDEPECSY